MAGDLAPSTIFTEQEYWVLEEGFEPRHEFYNGRIYLVAPGGGVHSDIVVNTMTALKAQTAGTHWKVRAVAQRLKIDATGLNTYPDVMVACEPIRYDPRQPHTMVDAAVIVEVQSKYTAAYDSGAKFEHYRQLPSLRHYLLVEQDSVRVEHRFLADGQWESRAYTTPDAAIQLTEISCQLVVGEFYSDVLFV